MKQRKEIRADHRTVLLGLAIGLASAASLPSIHGAQSLSENPSLGSTGGPPVPSGDPPDGMVGASFANSGAVFVASAPVIPVGGSPTGTGESPVPPNFQTLNRKAGIGPTPPRNRK